MKNQRCSRSGASERTRLRPLGRLRLGAVELDLMPDGWVRVVWPVSVDYRDLRSFLAAMRTRRAS